MKSKLIMAAIAVFSATLVQAAPPASKKDHSYMIGTSKLITTVGLIECRDPAANAINFRVIRKTGPYSARVQITGIVKNIGNANFVSSAGQQTAVLYENNRPVRTVQFTNLRANQSLTLNYQRNWNTSDEFPPRYDLVISYDPDIRLDSNKQNDDCRNQNNRKSANSNVLNGMVANYRNFNINPAKANARRQWPGISSATIQLKK